MIFPVLGILTWSLIAVFLVWLGLAAMAFWAWSASKSNAAMMTMVGAGLLAVSHALAGFGIAYDVFWFWVVGAAVLAYGYYLTVKPTIDANLAKLKEKAKAATHSGGSGGTPPANG